eukprot:GFUD01115607.1.p1 GENE.GFUD01115607.1~~GFUD01115607.1.p1  ORF type:complete len:235 (-),score=66.52 GFUD01115607.1:24-728(-)
MSEVADVAEGVYKEMSANAGNPVNPESVNVNPQIPDSIESEATKPTNKGKKKGTKIKTEPANGHLQFLRVRRGELKATNPEATLNMEQVRAEWATMSESEQAPYNELHKKEKMVMLENGDFRKGRKRKPKNVSSEVKERQPRKCKRTVHTKQDKATLVEKKSLSHMMIEFKAFEDEIKDLEDAVDNLRERNQLQSTQLAVSKTKLCIKSENVAVLKEKISNMSRTHRMCNITNE